MQVQYQLDLDDVVAFGLHHACASKDARRRLRRGQLWGIIFALFAALTWLRWGTVVWTIPLTAYALLMLFGYQPFCRWSVKHNTRKIYSEGQNKGAFGNHIIALDPEGVTAISDVGESRTGWAGIEKVEENEEYVFLYTGSLQAHVIPKRAFLGGAEAAEFFKLAQAYHSGSQCLTGG